MGCFVHPSIIPREGKGTHHSVLEQVLGRKGVSWFPRTVVLVHKIVQAPRPLAGIRLRVLVDVEQPFLPGVVAVVRSRGVRPHGHVVVCIFKRTELPVCLAANPCEDRVGPVLADHPRNCRLQVRCKLQDVADDPHGWHPLPTEPPSIPDPHLFRQCHTSCRVAGDGAHLPCIPHSHKGVAILRVGWVPHLNSTSAHAQGIELVPRQHAHCAEVQKTRETCEVGALGAPNQRIQSDSRWCQQMHRIIRCGVSLKHQTYHDYWVRLERSGCIPVQRTQL